MRNKWTLALLEVLNITLKHIKAKKTTYNSCFDWDIIVDVILSSMMLLAEVNNNV
ncbi:unnamed protein product [Brassica oleracea var. botrytis]